MQVTVQLAAYTVATAKTTVIHPSAVLCTHVFIYIRSLAHERAASQMEANTSAAQFFDSRGAFSVLRQNMGLMWVQNLALLACF